jgi:DNA-binding SARP family transcriptional activator
VNDPLLRRTRVRELLGLLVDRRRVSRRAVIDTLWPDKDEQAAANNLRVSLSQLNKLLEPERTPSAPPWFVRVVDDELVLNTGEAITLDVEQFTRAIERGRRADQDGRAADALAVLREALEWYRGDYLADVDVPAGETALRYRTAASDAAGRVAELLLAQGRLLDADLTRGLAARRGLRVA